MKVGTDGVLLGAWVAQEFSNLSPTNILDIGTGSGLIALMLAQQFDKADITGIDIDEQAVMQAQQNFRQSPWNNRLTAQLSSLETYQSDRQYDIIVCNPPFFSNSLKNPDSARAIARHNENLPYSTLVASSFNMLAPDGILCLVVPYNEAQSICNLVKQNGGALLKQCNIRGTKDKPYKRALLAFGKQEVGNIEVAELTLETTQHTRTDEYSHLTRDYYL